jgi:hypothetical protein
MNPGEDSARGGDERRRMIEERAYFRAERRGFVGGDPVADWLEAEAEVDRMLAQQGAAGKPGPIEQFEAQLKEWDEEIRRLVRKARGAKAEARAELERDLDKLRRLQAAGGKSLEALRGRSGATLEDVRKGVEQARADLSAALSAALKRWR